MTEAQWLAAKSPGSMVDHLVYHASRVFEQRRKLRLLVAACARKMLAALPDDRAMPAIIAAAERYADDPSARPEAVAARKPLRQAARRICPRGEAQPLKAAVVTLIGLTEDVLEGHTVGVENAAWVMAHPKANVRADARSVKGLQADLLRCVFGNPFRPVNLAPAHRTATVVSLAQAAYEERHLPSGELDPHRLAVLADALEESGAPGVLVAHLRLPGPHVRGCHVVDLCLGLS